MIGFMIGVVVGGCVGVVITCCCAAAGRADRQTEDENDR